MRVVHMTDVHFHLPPALGCLLGKRALGAANLYLLGRLHHFDAAAVVGRMIEDALAQEPDLFVFTGDVTALASEAEFAAARAAFEPMIAAVPSVFVPGNHDAYTRGAARSRRMESYFGDVMRGGRREGGAWVGAPEGKVAWPAAFTLDDVEVVGTNPCRPVLRSTGRFGPGAIARAEERVRLAREAGRQVLYLMHYPPLWDDGRPYDRSGHDLVDRDEVLGSLRREPPDAVLHGHNHTAWRTALRAGERDVPVLNCGTSSAVSPLPDRTAGYFVFDLEGGELRGLRRRILLGGEGALRDHPGDFSAPAQPWQGAVPE